MKKIYWLTGLPCSGKTTIAKELSRHASAEILDGDDIRDLTNNTDFSLEGRRKHMLNVAALAYRLSKYTNVIVSLVSPLKKVRDEIKSTYPNVIEIFVDCSLEECKKRDVKGMYAKALKGQIKDFTGVGSPYEEPTDAFVVDAEKDSLETCVNQIVENFITKKKYSLFIGRWQPLHKGHLALFDNVRQDGHNILIGIRDTPISDSDPYSVSERIEMIKEKVPDAEIVVLPDIEEVIYGRKVGWGVREVKLSKEVESISATKIREG